MHINRKIERFLIQYDMPATKFGRLVARDPRLVLDMRNGRELRGPMIARAEAFMAAYAIMIVHDLAQAA
jgi:hypothetical protein